MKLETLTVQTLRAMAKALDTEIKKRDDLVTGTYDVAETVTLNVQGTVSKFPDEEYTPTVKIAHKVAMALLVRHCGITGQAALNALERAIKESIEVDDKSETYIAAMADLTVAETKVQNMLNELPKATRAGKTTIKVKIT